MAERCQLSLDQVIRIHKLNNLFKIILKYIINDMKVFENKDINVKNINIKKKLKYSNDFTFVGLNYNKSEFLIQTPKLYCSYGVNEKYDYIWLYG